MVNSNLDYVVKNKVEHYLSLLWTTKHENPAYAIAFLTGALMSVIALAVKNDEFDDPTALSRLIEEMITGAYFSVS